MSEQTQCIATTRAGTRCKNQVQPGSPFCHTHQTVAGELEKPNGSGRTAPATPAATAADAGGEAMRQEMTAEIDNLIEELQEQSPSYAPPPFSPRALVDLVRHNLD